MMKMNTRFLLRLLSIAVLSIAGSGLDYSCSQTIRNPDQDLEEGLAAHWSFDGHIRDVSTNGINSFWVDNQGEEKENAPEEFFVDGLPGSGDKALNFHSEGYVEHDKIVFNIEESHSLSLWQWLPKNSPKNWHSILGSEWKDSGGYWFYHGGSLAKYHEVPNYVLRFPISLDNEIPLEEWFHLVIVTSPANVDDNKANYKIYINGSLKQDINREWIIPQFEYRWIGRGQRDRFAGIMDELRIYSRVLSEDEIIELYNLRE